MRKRWVVRAVTGALLLAAPVRAQEGLGAPQRARIDSAVAAVLAGTGAPSASIAVVQEGRIVYEQAYGTGRVDPAVPARPSMRYAIGSVSKQFTAAAVLLLAEAGKLSLDDRVSRWLPDLTRADEVTIRQLLSMTAGYQDYWPQDFVFPAMQRPTTAQAILDQWARKPLDFAPGSTWQYSNTNYVIAGLIVERVSGMPFLDFLRARIFTPLGMTSVRDFDAGPLGANDAGGYMRHALGPLRPAPKEGRGWLFAAGQLAMTAHDLARWDVSVIERSLLAPASYRTMQTDMLLAAGTSTRYGLGVGVGMAAGRRYVEHGGAVSGYLTQNVIYPDDRAAIVVFVNAYPGAADPTGQIAGRIAAVLFERADAEAEAALAEAQRIFAELQQGRIDRARFSANGNAFFDAQALADHAASLGPLGAPTEFTARGSGQRGGMTFRRYRVRVGGRLFGVTTYALPDGTLEQFMVDPAE